MEITVEKRRVVLTSKRRIQTFGWCEACAAQVRMVTPETAAILGGVSARTIYRWVETGRLHFTETHQGMLLICSNSLGD